ncbi:hypothetical protein [Halobacillus sp. A5]|uniref:hypothetical protein n=1 Tax=Halobacillus sp. A5 TaxID=2880263 RepID=UPI0020A6C25F|nr:hypothetical protein [Halobacillus sp. A5]MCP3027098.1 hypothetical protein [Halobacillus sp. A5]
MREKNLKSLSLACFVLSVVVWIPNTVFQIASPLWILTFVVAPAGIIFALLIKNYWLVIINTFMLFSFVILMALGYFVNSKI